MNFPRWTIKLKIGSGFLVAGIMLIVCGLAGLFLASSLSVSLSNFTGPVLQTTANANDGMLSVQSQLIAVQDILSGSDQDGTANKKLKEAEIVARQTLEGIRAAGQVEESELASLKDRMDNFTSAKDSLLKVHESFVSLENQIDQTVTQLLDFIIVIERFASQALLASQMEFDSGSEEEEEALEEIADNIDQEEGFADENEDADEYEDRASEVEALMQASRDLVNSASEARLALLNRLNLLNRFRSNTKDAEIRTRLNQVFDDLTYAGEMFAEDERIANKMIENGEFQGKSYAAVIQELIKLHGQQFNDSMKVYIDLKASKQNYSNVAESLIQYGQGLLVKIDESVASERTELSKVLKTGEKTIISVLVLGFVLALVIYFVTVKAITGPILQVREQMEDIAAGEGDLTQRLQVKGQDEVADLANAFNDFTDKLKGIIQTLQNHIAQLVDATSQISVVAEQSQTQTNEQKNEISGVVAAISELSSGSEQVVVNTSEAANGAGIANQEAQKGLAIMQSTISTIEAVAADVENTSTAVDDLGAKSDQIGVVLDVIRNISEQTNLLALNAAIEAARAGEQGRGFAVVADEVRGLAARTHDSIGEIQEIIDHLQSGTDNVIKQMNIVRENAVSSVAPVTEAGETLQSITAAVESIDKLNSEIAETAQTQSQIAVNADRNIINISDMSNESAQNAETLLHATTTLTQLGEELQQLAGQFKIS